MSEEAKMKAAKNTYDTICTMLDDLEYKYNRYDDDFAITCSIRGESFPIDIIFIVNPNGENVRISSPMPFSVPEDKRVDIALATTIINNDLVNGSFDFDMSEGKISFRMTQSYIGSIISKELFAYMFIISLKTIENYNEKLFMILKNMMSIEQFQESQND